MCQRIFTAVHREGFTLLSHRNTIKNVKTLLCSVFFSFPQKTDRTGNHIGPRKKLKVGFSLMEARIAGIRYGKVL